MKTIFQSVRMLVVMTILLGVGYPLLISLIGSTVFSYKSGGSMILKDGQVIGSELIAQKFEGAKYFHPRPSAGDYNPLPSGGTNLAPTSKKLQETAAAATKALGPNAPKDLIFASGSGLDPHISPEAAQFQVKRVAEARAFDEQKTARLEALVQKETTGRGLGFLGEETVNVLNLNLAVDKL